MPRRLRRADVSAPGIRRIRRGRGFSYLNPDGTPVTDPAVLDRIRTLVIPPAWENVWICPWTNGHIQAVGTDAAGRRQYRYHDLWRAQRDRDKFDRVLRMAARLPRARQRIAAALATDGLTRTRVLACAARLLDLGFFRIGGEEYADENGTYGLATMRKEHVSMEGRRIEFTYVAKGSQERVQSIVDDDVRAVVLALKRRRGGSQELLAYRNGSRWYDVHSADVNAYLRELLGGEWTAKDFRTWHATVLMAVGLAVSTQAPTSPTARKRAITRAVREVAEYLGNTPAVARASYIDPRVIDLYNDGVTIAPALHRLGEGQDYGEPATHGVIEAAVLRMLRGAGKG
jgi:DNA topoisomerase-1